MEELCAVVGDESSHAHPDALEARAFAVAKDDPLDTSFEVLHHPYAPVLLPALDEGVDAADGAHIALVGVESFVPRCGAKEEDELKNFWGGGSGVKCDDLSSARGEGVEEGETWA